MKKLTLTEKQTQAHELHRKIMANGYLIASALVEFCRELKEMRDLELYKELSFSSFDDYVEKAVGLKKRQAYNYITTYEGWGPKLLEQNAALGITKLEILSHLPATDREDVIKDNDFEGMSAKEVKELVEKYNNAGEQISLLEKEITQAKEESAEVIKLREKVKSLEETAAKLDEMLDAASKEPIDIAAVNAQELENAKKQAAADAKAQAEKEYLNKLTAEKEKMKKALEKSVNAEKAKALERAAELEKKLALSSSEESTAFALHFDLLQQSFNKMQELAARLEQNGNTEQAAKLKKALKAALLSLADSVQEVLTNG